VKQIQKVNVVAEITCHFCGMYCFTKAAQRIFELSEILSINLILDKALDNLIIERIYCIYYVIIYRSYKPSKLIRVLLANTVQYTVALSDMESVAIMKI